MTVLGFAHADHRASLVGVAMPVSAEIIKNASQGDRNAQRVIFEAFRVRVHQLVGRMVGECDAEDVAQDTFMRVFEKLHQFRQDSELGTWVHRIAVNQAIKHLNRRTRNATSSWVDDYGPASRMSDTGDIAELVKLAIDKIDPELKAVLQLKEIDGLTYSQIAEIVEIPEGTVGSRLNRARKELREQLIALGWES
jgi:RNA polymerase sigma-70 factor (ECF subfamily)